MVREIITIIVSVWFLYTLFDTWNIMQHEEFQEFSFMRCLWAVMSYQALVIYAIYAIIKFTVINIFVTKTPNE